MGPWRRGGWREGRGRSGGRRHKHGKKGAKEEAAYKYSLLFNTVRTTRLSPDWAGSSLGPSLSLSLSLPSFSASSTFWLDPSWKFEMPRPGILFRFLRRPPSPPLLCCFDSSSFVGPPFHRTLAPSSPILLLSSRSPGRFAGQYGPRSSGPWVTAIPRSCFR